MALHTHLALLLTLVALGLAPGVAHLLELPVKLGYSPVLYAEVTSTLYRWYGIVGGGIQVAAVLVALAFAARVRKSHRAGLAGASAVALLVSLALWASLVAPANAEWSEVVRAGSERLVAAYVASRSRWEYGHVAAFIAWLVGWFGFVTLATRPSSGQSGGV